MGHAVPSQPATPIEPDPAAEQVELTALGFDAAADNAYRLVLERRHADLAELTVTWAGPADRLHAALAALAGAGLVHVLPGRPVRYAAADPGSALGALLADREERLDRAHRHAQLLAERFRARQAGARQADAVEIVVGTHAIRQRIVQVQRSANVEICCLDKPPYLDQQGTAATALDLRAAGVAARSIYDRAAIGQTGGLPEIERLIQAGGKARVLPNLPIKLCLVDGGVAFLPLHSRLAGSDAAAIVHPSRMLDALAELFEILWHRAVPLQLAGPGTQSQPQAQARRREAPFDDQRLIALLLSGLTDETIARQLGVSYRTLQRRIAALMADLGAHTRFQAGVQAALRHH
jgi:hypothetical protein